MVSITLVIAKAGANPSTFRLSFVACFAALAIGLGIRAPRSTLYSMIVWLAALGLTRRLLTHGGASVGAADPLLLVEPLALGLLLLAAFRSRSARIKTPLGTSVLALAALIVFGAVNPLQGTITAGATGLLFFMPVASFWIGRSLGDATLKRSLMLYAVCAVPAALYGRYQVSNGFPSWDQAWIDRSGYSALQVLGAVRPFSSFSSASEYATFLAIGIVIWVVLWRPKPRFLRIITVGVVALLGQAVFYQSSRGSLVMIFAALGLALAAKRRLRLSIAAVAGLIALALVPIGIRQIAPVSYGDTTQDRLAQHQLQGLANPFDSKQSTATAHMSLLVNGMLSAFHHPAGRGISSVTIAGKKFGAGSTGAEADPGNVAIAMGLPGLIAFMSVLVLAIGNTYRLAVRRRDALSLTVLGILTVTMLQWLNGGQYAVAFLPWLLLGWVDTQTAKAKQPAPTDIKPDLTVLIERPRPRTVLPISPRPRVNPNFPTVDASLARVTAPSLPLTSSPDSAHSVWHLETLLQGATYLDFDHQLALRFLLIEIRPYAQVDGRLPEFLDELIEREFGFLIRDSSET